VRTSKITTYGGGRDGAQASSFKIGAVTVLVSGAPTGDCLYIAEELARAWNRDEPPEEKPLTSAADDVLDLCVRLLRGPVTTARFSAGPWTPSVADGFSWAVLDRHGAPLLLAHDAFEAGLYLARLEDGTCEIPSNQVELPTDADLAERTRVWDWEERYRFMCPM
jgi:hypothetical protein